MKLSWAPRALQQLENALGYIAQENSAAAWRVYDRVVAHAARLTEFPELGPVGREAGTRELVIVGTPFVVVRSLGAIANGPAGSSQVTGPDQFAAAQQQSGSGAASALYDASGNLTSLSDNVTETSYSYTWDELGRLSGATRADKGVVHVADTFAYDAQGQRMRTTRQMPDANGVEQTDHTMYVFDSLVLEHAAFPGAPGDYERDAKTEHLYLTAGGAALGHVFYDESQELPTTPASGNGNLHVFMPISDPLGSTSLVIDHDSGEVVERISYQAYGGVDSDYRPPRWGSFREDVRYTGHWDDAQVGLVYFGARYYSPALLRFISPDPLTVHSVAGDLTPYAFVGGSPVARVDPFGLDDDDDGDGDPANDAGST